ncbi:hypothetical protein MMC13_008215 [Lambiella insularis]|nr:hypothetical protein [Lambiella insularis]
MAVIDVNHATGSPLTEVTHATASIGQPAQKGALLSNEVADSGKISSGAPASVEGYPKSAASQNLAEEWLQSTVSSPSTSDPTPKNSTIPNLDPATNRKIGSRRGSKSGATDKVRNGSAESIRRFAPEHPVPAGTTAQSTTPVPTAITRPDKKKRGGISRLISKFNCCGGSEDANAIDLDERAVPARKSSKIVSGQARQASPAKKPNASAAESSLTESKEMSEEKIGGPPYSTLKSAGDPKYQELPKAAASMVIPSTQPILTSTSDNQQTAQTPPIVSQQNPAEPSNVPALETKRNIPEEASPTPQRGSVIVVPPTPTSPTAAEQGSAIDDRTPLQEKQDSDIEMVDAPPIEPVVEEPEERTERSEAEVEPPLPPPPPLAPRAEISAPGHDRGPLDNVTTTKDQQKWLLPPLKPEFRGKKCLVLDLDETLVHSSFKILHQADFTIPVEIEGQYHNVYVIKRPGVDQFMKRVGELYEVVVFTASVSKYGDPLLDQLDIHHVVHHRLFRESCYNHQGNYVKDLSQVGRDLRETIIIDNSPTSYIFHPQHAVPISSWFSDAHDNELLDLIPVLEDLAGSQVRDVSLVLDVAL